MSMATTSNNFPDTHYVNLLPGKKKHAAKRQEPLKGVKRALKLFILCFILPLLLLIYPLYLRNRVYTRQDYPMGVSDMLIIDKKISTTWCQKQVINSNTTYNAYVIADEPQISQRSEKIDMTRTMLLKDGAKEYWGFYLLKGSTFTISTCVRWPGASLIVIEGHKNLKECAYVGDNSSEENDKSESSEENRNISIPKQMTRISAGVSILNYPWERENSSELSIAKRFMNELNPLDKPPKTDEKLKNLHLQYAEDLYLKEHKKSANKLNAPAVETTSLPLLPEDSAEVLNDVLAKLKTLGPKGKQVLLKLTNRTADVTTDKGTPEDVLNILDELIKDVYGKSNGSLSKNNRKYKMNETTVDDQKEEFQKLHNEIMQHRSKISLVDRESNTGQEVFYEADKADMHVSIKNTKHDDRSKSEYWSSVSSSEERLLECKGLLVSLPLIPNHECNANYDDKVLKNLATANHVSYTIQWDGYYFFIYNNENEVEKNFIYAHFNITKTIYNTSEAIAVCRNKTSECSLPLSFWSRERTILEKQKPYPMNDDWWNEEFIITTQCEPRSIIYVICSMSVFMGILLFAFT